MLRVNKREVRSFFASLLIPDLIADLSDQAALLSLNNRQEKPRQVTPRWQGAASSFLAKAELPKGFGYLPLSTRFDPTVERSLRKLFFPTMEAIQRSPRLVISGEKPSYNSWGETVSGGVQDQTEKCLSSLFLHFVRNGQEPLSSKKLLSGLVNPTSYNDFHYRYHQWYLMCGEHKGAEGSLLGAVLQMALTNTHFAMGLLERGVPREKCIIPGVANTGMLMLFGATIILDDSFPTFVPLTKQLDLLDAAENQMASAFLARCQDYCLELGKSLTQNPILPSTYRPSEMSLDSNKYFIKVLTPDIIARGFGLFTTPNSDQIQPGIEHMLHALNRIFDSSEARDLVEYPLSIRTPAAENEHFEIIYRDLTLLPRPFVMGVPNRIENPKLYESFQSALVDAVDRIHRAGVIHCDLYASNIMWRLNEETNIVEIKIIDWDTAHCLSEGKFNDVATEILAEFFHIPPEAVEFGIAHDMKYLDVYLMDFTEEQSLWWIYLSERDKAFMDVAFRCLFVANLESKR
jgi:hypothetical protein